MAGRRVVSYGGAVGGDRPEGDSGVDGFDAQLARLARLAGPVDASCAILEVRPRGDDRWWIADGPASGVPGGHGWRCVSRREIAERFWDVDREVRVALPPPKPGTRLDWPWSDRGFAFDFVDRRVIPLPRGADPAWPVYGPASVGRPIRASYVFAPPDRDAEPEEGDVT